MPDANDGGMSIQGNPTPAFQQAMKQVQAEKTEGGGEAAPPAQQPAKQRPPMGPTTAPTGPLQDMLKDLQVLNYEEVVLPSRGVFYSDDSVLSGGVLHVRPMTGAEEEILATPRYVKKNEAIDMIFRKCSQEDYNPLDLLTIDRTFLLIWLRGISYSNEYEVEVKCPECDAKGGQVINLNALEVNYCPEDFGSANMMGTLPKTNYKFAYKLSTGRDENKVNAYREKRVRQFGATGTDDTLTYRTAQLLNNIGEIDDANSLTILLKRLPISDVSYLRSLVNDPPFGVDTEVDLVCPSCTADFNIDMPLEAGFFFPQYKRKEEE